MPPVSQAQRRAMYAAAEGKSSLGIPAKVGKEFVAADSGGKLPKRAKPKPKPKPKTKKIVRGLVFAVGLFGAAQAYAAPGSLASCSGTVGTTAAGITFSQRPQIYVEITNPSASATLWVDPTGGTAAANASGSGSIAPGGYLWFDGPVQPNQFSIIADAAATPYTCWYR